MDVPLFSPPCALCGGSDFTTVLEPVRDEVWHKPGQFSLQRCQDCGLVATRPRPTDEGLAFYYDQAYSGAGRAVDGTAFYASGPGQTILRFRLAALGRAHAVGPDDRLLDVGCSTGSFLSFARRRTGCAASGIDIDEGSIADALDADQIDYRVGRLTDGGYDEGAFTVVTFLECLEHETDPVGALRAAWRVLEPGGCCLVEVPDFGSPWRQVFGRSWLPLLVPQHVSHFERATLARAMQEAGFEVVHRQSMMYPAEFVASLAILLGRWFGPPQGADASLGRRAYEWSGVVVLFGLWWLIDLPTQLLLRLLGRTGHQAVVGQKKAPLSRS